MQKREKIFKSHIKNFESVRTLRPEVRRSLAQLGAQATCEIDVYYQANMKHNAKLHLTSVNSFCSTIIMLTGYWSQ